MNSAIVICRSLLRDLNPAFFDYENAKKTLFKQFSTTTLKPFGLDKSHLAVCAAGALAAYLKTTQTATADQLSRLTSYDSGEFMLLDINSMRSLEILQSESGASLFSIIDRTKTSMGGRLLRKWLRQPLLDCAEIFRRQEHLAWLKENKNERESLLEILSDIKDLERLSSRAKANLISPYELRAFGKSLELIPKIKKILQADAVRFGKLLAELPECRKIGEVDRNFDFRRIAESL